jgi:flavin-dependent dehydrogenase
MALRAHVHSQVQAARIVQLQVVWHRALRGGYGWIFPAGDGRFNVGVGIMHATRGPRAGGSNLRELFETFTQEHPPARQLMQDAALLGDFKGAPLRCSLSGAAVARPGLLVAGEAAGSTYLFTGEGIGKAMESGMLAAQALAAGRLLDDAAACAHYEGAVAALKPRFAAYEVANRFNEHPWLVDLVAWRARRSAAFAARLAGVLDESEDPARLASVGGLARLLWPLG